MTTTLTEADRHYFDRRESKMNGDTFAGLEYDTDLCSSRGVSVTLYVTDSTTPEQIEKAKSEARNKRDVAHGFHLVKVPQIWLDAETPEPSTHKGGLIEAARWIKEHGSCRRVNRETGELIPEKKRGGLLIDLFSASAFVSVYDALNETNKAKLSAMPPAQAVNVVFSCLNKQNA